MNLCAGDGRSGTLLVDASVTTESTIKADVTSVSRRLKILARGHATIYCLRQALVTIRP